MPRLVAWFPLDEASEWVLYAKEVASSKDKYVQSCRRQAARQSKRGILGSKRLMNVYPEAQQRARAGSGEEYMEMTENLRLDDKGRRESTRKGEMKTKVDGDIRVAGRTIPMCSRAETHRSMGPEES